MQFKFKIVIFRVARNTYYIFPANFVQIKLNIEIEMLYRKCIYKEKKNYEAIFSFTRINFKYN